MASSSQQKIVGELLAEHFARELSTLAQSIFEEDRPLLTLRAAQMIIDAGLNQRREVVGAEAQGSAAGAWEKIISLSQLRALVGGRFQQLKDRWVGAGFPLREHRGDRSQKASFDEKGWLELSAWISRQGFEVRRNPALDDELFSIRPIK